jgi:PAS domain S-box-containing protein
MSGVHESPNTPIQPISSNDHIWPSQSGNQTLAECQTTHFFDNAPDAMVIVDDEECCVNVNAAACQLFGVPRHTLIGTHIISDFIRSEIDFDAVWQTTLMQEKVWQEVPIILPDGTRRITEFQSISNVSAHLHLLVFRDITQQKDVEQRHQFLQQQVETFFELSIDLLAIANTDGFFIHLNPAWETTLGFSLDELKSVRFIEFVHPDDVAATQQQLETLMRGKSVTAFENRYRTHDGHYRWLSWRSEPPTSNQLVYATARDVTAQKETERQLQAYARQEQALNRVIQVIHQSLDLDEIFSTSAAEIAQLLDGEVAIVQYVPERACWIHRIVYDRGEAFLSKVDTEIPDADNPLAARLKQHQIVQIDDTATIGDPINQELAKTSPGSWLLTPIIIAETVWGSLTLGRQGKTRKSWSENEIKLAKRVARQLAIAIQQSQLYQQVQTLNTNLEAKVTDRTSKLQTALNFESALKRITDKVRDSLDETQILQTAVDELLENLNVDCCDTALYNDDKTLSTIVYEASNGWEPAKGKVIQLQKSPNPQAYAYLLERKECQFCKIDNYFLRNTQYRISTLAVPIFDDQDVLGDLWLFKPADQAFSTQEVRLVQQVATQCAIALRQARLYQTAQKQVAELEQLNQMKDDILGMVSHDLRSPMANIKMSAEMLEVSLRRLSIDERNLATSSDAATHLLNAKTVANMERYIQVLHHECQRETELLNDLLDIARVESGNVSIDAVFIQLEFWLQSVIESFTDRINSRDQHLQLKVSSGLSMTTDPSCLERVIAELLHNACKYTPAGETIWVDAQPSGTDVEFTVGNSGAEIPADECDRIFDKFYRIPNNDPWKQGGTGLGLALCKKLITRLNGEITVESRNNQTWFTVTLPRSFAPSQSSPPPSNQPCH